MLSRLTAAARRLLLGPIARLFGSHAPTPPQQQQAVNPAQLALAAADPSEHQLAGPAAVVFAQPHLRDLVFAYHRDHIEELPRAGRARACRARRERHERARQQLANGDWSPQRSRTGGSTASRRMFSDFFDFERHRREEEERRAQRLAWEDEHDADYGDLTPESVFERLGNNQDSEE